MTTREWLAAWDRGESVWSVDMGGMGPSYEQALQTLMVEMVRDCNCELTADEMAMTETRWSSWRDDTIERLDGLPWGGFSGAQVGAAKILAFRILRDGPEGVKESVRAQGIDDRLIQIRNDDRLVIDLASDLLDARKQRDDKAASIAKFVAWYDADGSELGLYEQVELLRAEAE